MWIFTSELFATVGNSFRVVMLPVALLISKKSELFTAKL